MVLNLTVTSRPRDGCPETPTAVLSTGGQLLVWSIRQWLVSARARRCVVRDLWAVHQRLNATSVIVLVDEWMQLLSLAAFRPVLIRCPADPALSPDEMKVLGAMRALQREDEDCAHAIIREMVSQRLGRSLLRTGKVYVSELCALQLPLTGVRALQVVGASS